MAGVWHRLSGFFGYTAAKFKKFKPLFQKGINREIVEEALRLVSTRSGQISEEDLAKFALEKKMKSWKNLEPLEFRKKATEFLLRRRFEYKVVKEVISKLSFV